MLVAGLVTAALPTVSVDADRRIGRTDDVQLGDEESRDGAVAVARR